MANEKPKSVIEEAGLDPTQWAEVDSSPIVPGKTPAPALRGNDLGNFYSGSIPSSLQHDADFVKTGYDTGLAIGPLMPVSPSGAPSTNAAIVSAVGPTPAPASTSSGMKFKGSWNSFTTYSVGDVVIFNVSAYVATKSGVNKQPDSNVPAFWAVLAECLAFDAVTATGGSPGFGAFDTNAVATSDPGPATASATPSENSGLAILVSSISNGTPGLTGWGDWGTAVGVSSEGIYVKSFNSSSAVSSSQTAGGRWCTNLSLFQGNGDSLTASITSVQVTGNVVTVTCPQNFAIGTQVVCSGLTGASFLNGQVLTILSNTGTRFTATFSNADYGPAADSGTAQNLPYFQATVLVNGALNTGTITGSFANPVKPGSTIVVVAAVNDVNGKCILGAPADPIGSYTVINKVNPIGSSADIAFAQNVVGGGTSIAVTISTNSTFGCLVAFEVPGGGGVAGNLYLPYDVEMFRGSMYVANKETTQDAFADPTSWWLLAQGTGSVDALSGAFAPGLVDYGRLISNSTSSTFTVTLPNPPPSNSWWISAANSGTGTVVLDPNGLDIDGSASTITLAGNQGMFIFTDGKNYFSVRGFASGGGAPTTDLYVLGTADLSNLPNAVANPYAFFGPDAAPSSPGSLDDEFNGSALDLTRWTEVGFTGSAAAAVSKSLLSFTADGSTTNASAIVQTSPTPTWQVITKMTAASPYAGGSDFRRAGFAVFATGTVASVKAAFFSFYWSNRGTLEFAQDNYTDITSYSSTPNSQSLTLGTIGPTVWISLENDGTNLTFAYSVDGVNYITLWTYGVSTFTGTIGYVGLQVSGSVGTTIFSFDYFRQTI